MPKRYVLREASLERFLSGGIIRRRYKTLRGALKSIRRMVAEEGRSDERCAHPWLGLYDCEHMAPKEFHLLTVMPNGTDKGPLA